MTKHLYYYHYFYSTPTTTTTTITAAATTNSIIFVFIITNFFCSTSLPVFIFLYQRRCLQSFIDTAELMGLMLTDKLCCYVQPFIYYAK